MQLALMIFLSFRFSPCSDPPSFVIRPKTQFGEVGGEAIFECQATGSPQPTLYWSIEGDRLLILPGTKVRNIEASKSTEGSSSFLSFYQLSRSDNGKVVVCR